MKRNKEKNCKYLTKQKPVNCVDVNFKPKNSDDYDME